MQFAIRFFVVFFSINLLILKTRGFSLIGAAKKAGQSQPNSKFSPTQNLGKQFIRIRSYFERVF